MKGLSKFVLVMAKALEILHWAGAALMVVTLTCSWVAKDWFQSILTLGIDDQGPTLTTYGFDIMAINTDGTLNMTAVSLFSIGAIIIFALMAMVFRNIYLIIRTANGKTSFSKGVTPFQNDIVRMMREIGIFFIASPIVGFIMSAITIFFTGIETLGASINFESLIIGIFVICLSQFFSYGKELQEDVDGLL